jgi:hypothetical protein
MRIRLADHLIVPPWRLAVGLIGLAAGLAVLISSHL